MRIIIVGSTGTIGMHVAAELEKRYEVIRASAFVERGIAVCRP